LPAAQTFVIGTAALIELRFTAVLPSLVAVPLQFSDQPLAREVVGAVAQVLDATYVDGSITIIGPSDLDLDHDGMPDEWELAHGLNPNDGNDAAVDDDGDGQTNFEEYVAGTDPHNSADALAILSLNVQGTDVLARFRTIAGKTYVIEHNDNPGLNNWTEVRTLTGTGDAMEAIDPGASSSVQRLFRVRVGP
jgi:hypothetical protein